MNYDDVMNIDKLSELTGSVIYFVGIKGTGMTALAEIFRSRGAIVTGSDVDEKFYTDNILAELGIPVYEGFSENNLPDSIQLLVHSAAYQPDSHPEIMKARARGIEVLSYAEALGRLSIDPLAAGISGVHGKTTTTAMAGTLLREFGLPGTVLTGSAASNFDGRSTLVEGDRFFIAETCEYKRNFLNFRPDYLVITSIEPDHLDYYRDYDDVLSAFVEYAAKLSVNGRLIYCADDPGAVQAAELVQAARTDLIMIPYGFTADGEYRIIDFGRRPGQQYFRISKYHDDEFVLRVPGKHNILNITAATALIECILADNGFTGSAVDGLQKGIYAFCGTKRRSEIVGDAGGVVIMDDYGHHPSAIKTTIEGLRDFYSDRRIIVDFMSHTYSRTEALIDGFASCFGSADLVLLHKIYASAREKTGKITGKDLYNRVAALHPNVYYFEEVMDAADFIYDELRPGDLFVTMGAGDNWKLGLKIYDQIIENAQGCTE